MRACKDSKNIAFLATLEGVLTLGASSLTTFRFTIFADGFGLVVIVILNELGTGLIVVVRAVEVLGEG